FPQSQPLQPQPQHLHDLDHRHLPVAHLANTAAQQPEDPEATPGWSHNWQNASQVVPSMANRWSHPHGKTSPEVVPFTWQPTDGGGGVVVNELGDETRRHCRGG